MCFTIAVHEVDNRLCCKRSIKDFQLRYKTLINGNFVQLVRVSALEPYNYLSVYGLTKDCRRGCQKKAAFLKVLRWGKL